MSDQVPILDAERVVHFRSRRNFMEALCAVISGEWIMVAPRTTIKLRSQLSVALMYDGDGTRVQAHAIPLYWRGTFLGMQVKPIDNASARMLVGMVASLEESIRRGDPEPALPVPGAPGAAEPAAAQAQKPPAPAAPSARHTVPEVPPTLLREVASVKAIPLSDGRDELTSDATSDVSARRAEVTPGPVPEESTPSGPDAFSDKTTTVNTVFNLLDQATQPGVTTTMTQPIRGEEGDRREQTPALVFSTSLVPFRPEEEVLASFPATGALEVGPTASFYAVAATLAAADAHGLLEIASPAGLTRIYLRGGALLGVDLFGAAFDDMLRAAMERAQVCAGKKLEEALDWARRERWGLVVALYELRIVPPEVVQQLEREVKEEALTKVILCGDSAKCSFYRTGAFAQRFGPVRIHLLSFLVQLLRRLLPSSRVPARLLEKLGDRYPVFAGSGAVPMETLSLSDRELHVVDTLLGGAHTLREVVSMSPLVAGGTTELVALLNHFGFLRWVAEAYRPEKREYTSNILEQQLQQFRNLDYFERLGIHWASHPGQIEAAYKAAVATYGPESALSQRSPRSRKLCDEIVALIQRSYLFLRHRDQRRKYRLERVGESKVSYAADLLARRADVAWRRGQRDEAFLYIETAIDLLDNPAYVQLHDAWKTR